MAKRALVVGTLLFVLTGSTLLAKKKDESSHPIFPDVTARGQLLYECDQAAWHSSDALMATNPSKENLGRYIPKKSDSGWVVGFGRLNDAGDKFLVAYEASQGATLQDFTVNKFDPPREDTSFYLFAARAIDTALADFRGEKRPYNAAVLPAPDNQLYVYILPAQTQDNVYPLGGDVRYLISPDGKTIIEKHQMHKGILEMRNDIPKGATTEAGVHTHVLSSEPEDSDVFHVLTRKPSVPELVVTGKKEGFEILTDGTILQWKH